MTGWRISPDGVQGVLEGVVAVAGVLSSAVDDLSGATQEAVSGTADSAIIADALVGFFEAHKPTLESIGHRLESACTGAALATTAYLQGDEQMAAEQQAAALSLAPGGGGPP